jgi:tetratricopeptide (TPR) repeat protein
MLFFNHRLNRAARMFSVSALLLVPALAASAQAPACPAVPEHEATTLADKAYGQHRYESAEDLYQSDLGKHAGDSNLTIRLIDTLLHENKTGQAAALTNTLLAADPHSAAALTAQAEVQLRQGEPWAALQTLDVAGAADPCYARAHLVRSHALRIDSMYATERAELQTAYDIDPTDPDIQFAWLSIDSSARDVENTSRSLTEMKDLDPDLRQKAEANVRTLLPQISENSQTCQVVPNIASATLPMQPTMSDARHVDGYRLEVELPQGKLKLLVDTAASGLYISKAVADQNGFKAGLGDPPGTVRADKVRIGPLEFHDCLVGVSETPFQNKGDGFIGTDVFSNWLITIDHRLARINLAPLPALPSILPGNRLTGPEFAGYTPVYHRRQYLMVPLTFGNNSRKLFILATGMRYSAMTSATAHSLSKMTVNFTNTEETAQGTRVNFFREVFDMHLGNLPQIHQGHILEFDPGNVSHNAGLQIAGMLGLDILQPLNLQIDYRDGLVKFDNPVIEPGSATPPTMIASNSTALPDGAALTCTPFSQQDRPTNSTIQAQVTGTLEAGHLKPGKEVFVKVMHGVTYPDCTLEADSILYGHVTAATAAKNAGGSELSIAFDHGECSGHGKRALPLNLIGIVGPPDASSRRIHDDVPDAKVSGGGRSISGAAAELIDMEDENLNPTGTPHTVHPGIVVRMPNVTLDPQGGPACSARITNTSRSVQLGTGSELILTMSAPGA